MPRIMHELFLRIWNGYGEVRISEDLQAVWRTTLITRGFTDYAYQYS